MYKPNLMLLFCTITLLSVTVVHARSDQNDAGLAQSIIDHDVVFEERDGLTVVEAEFFHSQSAVETRQWYRTSKAEMPVHGKDPDVRHLKDASYNAYLEILPDTRTHHGELLEHGVNFSNQPGKMGILHYKVHFNNPGRYYVWVRAHSTGTEDNGIHVGVNGEWPESGQRMQWCEGKNGWRWESKQRTEDQHCGVPYKIYLDIEKPGVHDIQFSMREDGFEFDKFLLTTDRSFPRPDDAGPGVMLKEGVLPPAFPEVDVDPVDGDGTTRISGELKQWHKVTMTMDGPFARETDQSPNPFTDYRMEVEFWHESGEPAYRVPGYFAADGNAGSSGQEAGNKWRAHLSPDKTGRWFYKVRFYEGSLAALTDVDWMRPLKPYHQQTGEFTIDTTDKTGRDFRSKGRLEYVGKHHLQFQGSREYFLKAGPDAPETFLAYEEFDGTRAYKDNVPLKKYEPHIADWKEGDPTWQNGKGKGIIGALNYLSNKGLNAFSFITYNAGGDGDNVWPFIGRDDKMHYDCSKLDQWQLVFDHAQSLGLHLHFKTQETENDDHNHKKLNHVPQALDGGELGPERRLYYRELIARFGYLLGLNWNLGEENTQTPEQQRAMAQYFHDHSPYRHNIVIHTYPDEQHKVYPALLGTSSALTGASLQNSWDDVHELTLHWLEYSDYVQKPWVVANDEQGSAKTGVPPDPGYQGYPDTLYYNLHDVRKQTLWGNLMAGGAGVEYYFGYHLPENDLLCEDFRSRDRTWDFCRIALDFFSDHNIPYWEMSNANQRIGNAANGKEKYCLAMPDELYLVYLGYTSTSQLDLKEVSGKFSVEWFNPRTGGKLKQGSVKSVQGGSVVQLGNPPSDQGEDWLVVVQKEK